MFNKVYLSIFIKYFKLFLVTINFLERKFSFFLFSFLPFFLQVLVLT